MQTTITLQEPFSYSLTPILLIAAALILLAVVMVWLRLRKIRPAKERFTKKEQASPDQYGKFLEDVKSRYLDRTAALEKSLSEGSIGERECYQELSLCVRRFVNEVTGVEITKMTLTEIQKLRMPHIRDLIAEFYEPEFAQGAQADVKGAIEKTKRIIREWK